MRAVGRRNYYRRKAVCQVQHCFILRLSSLVEFKIAGYCDPPRRLRHAGRQDTDLSCHVPILIFVALCYYNQRYRQTDRQTDVVFMLISR